jgi:hypothetical protein
MRASATFTGAKVLPVWSVFASLWRGGQNFAA